MALVVLAVGTFGLTGVRRVPPEHVGVQYHRFGDGTDLEDILPSGVHWLPPWDQVYLYSLSAQDVLSDSRFLDSRGNSVKVGYLVRFELEPAVVAELHKMIGPDYVETWVRPTIESVLRSMAASPETEPGQTGAIDEWSRLASMEISPAMETAGLHLIYFRIQSIVVTGD